MGEDYRNRKLAGMSIHEQQMAFSYWSYVGSGIVDIYHKATSRILTRLFAANSSAVVTLLTYFYQRAADSNMPKIEDLRCPFIVFCAGFILTLRGWKDCVV